LAQAFTSRALGADFFSTNSQPLFFLATQEPLYGVRQFIRIEGFRKM
jgi:hypothetical protein